MSNSTQLIPGMALRSLPATGCQELRRRAIFECCKWDPQVEDVDTLAPMALVLKQPAWRELRVAAEAMAAETQALQQALARRPDLHRTLALPCPIRKVLACASAGEAPDPHLRVMRFDFHPTDDGWRVSEANTDVPGGYNEASGWTSLVAEHVPEAIPAGDPAARLVEAIAAESPGGSTVALVHATAYSDDRQVMTFLARRLQQRGFRTALAAPDHLEWREGRPIIRTRWFTGAADFVFRFFPAEWLPNLGWGVDWKPFFGSSRAPLCNPATALLTQTKRWPLVCGQLALNLPAWRQYQPETRDPGEVDWRRDPGWVLKPALGRVGERIGLHGVTEARDWKSIRRELRWWGRHWVAQRRFASVPLLLEGRPWHVCLGVYTVGGRAAGIYGRAARQPLINHLARDLAVLVEPAPTRASGPRSSVSYGTPATV
jgi:glutathionylspermidine synthase